MRKIALILLMLLGITGVMAGCGGNPSQPENSIFDFAALSQEVPELEDAGYCYQNNENIQAVYFEGAEYNGAPTKIFAYIGTPETEKPAQGYPAMVLVHGGLGRAFPDWVKMWTDRGYVAIALSVDANITDAQNSNAATANPLGGPNISITPTDMQNPKNSWEYISVANIIFCHNILRSMEEVDESNIGITGISWGSFLTCVTIGVDNRFKFAVPVYGAGYMDEDVSGGLKDVFAMDDASLEIYRKSFDPSAYMGNCTIPTLWFCGANDYAFSIGCTQRCADLSKGETYFSWRASLTHGQQPGDGSGLPEIFLFADLMVKGTSSLPLVDEGTAKDGKITVTCENGAEIASAKLFYSNYPLEYWHDPGNTWNSQDATVQGNTLEVEIPSDALFAFMQITDSNGYIVSSRLFSF